jgi:dTDP-4-amino-4,6-dideoxygalactose transaminase
VTHHQIQEGSPQRQPRPIPCQKGRPESMVSFTAIAPWYLKNAATARYPILQPMPRHSGLDVLDALQRSRDWQTAYEQLRAYLSEHGVGTDVYYPLPLHLQPCFASLGYRKGDFPAAEQAAEESLALPMYPELSEAQQVYVVQQVADFYRQ